MSFNAFDSNSESILDKSYGEIVFTSHTWGIKEDGIFFLEDKDLESYSCSKEELGTDKSQGKRSRFMPLHYSSKKTVEMKQKTFICINKEDSYV